MSRWEFMRQLEELLSDISPSEKEEALQYYNDYFNDAGRENEQEVIKALGSPAQVAGIVRDGLSDNSGSGEFTENGFTSTPSSQQNPVIKREYQANAGEKDIFAGQEKNMSASKNKGESSAYYENPQKEGYGESRSGAYGESQKSAYGQSGQAGYDNSRTGGYQESGTDGASAYTGEIKTSSGEKKKGMSTWAIALIIIGCVLLAPAILGGIGGIVGTLFGIVATIAAAAIAIAASAFVLYFAAVLLVVTGIGCLFVSPIKGIGLLGAGFICGALGIFCMLFTYFLATKAMPGAWRGIKYLYKKVTNMIGGGKQ